MMTLFNLQGNICMLEYHRRIIAYWTSYVPRGINSAAALKHNGQIVRQGSK